MTEKSEMTVEIAEKIAELKFQYEEHNLTAEQFSTEISVSGLESHREALETWRERHDANVAERKDEAAKAKRQRYLDKPYHEVDLEGLNYLDSEGFTVEILASGDIPVDIADFVANGDMQTGVFYPVYRYKRIYTVKVSAVSALHHDDDWEAPF